jgi:alpha-L-arabinofuranosidase
MDGVFFPIMSYFEISRGVARLYWNLVLLLAMAIPFAMHAQTTNMPIYTDSLLNGWSDGSYNVTLNYSNTSPVYAGSDSISVTINSAYGGVGLSHSSLTTTGYASVSFWLNGGSSGGQRLQMYGNMNYNPQSARYALAAPLANTWQQYTVPLSALGVANATNFTGFVIQDSAGSTESTFYLDNIQLNVPTALPTLVHFSVNASQPIRSADSRWFGLNGAMWDSYYDTPTTVSLLNEEGTRIIRLPGGSLSDQYHWNFNRTFANDWTWQTSFANFIHVITNASVNAQAIITVNYGTGTPQEAAAWVAYCNATTSSSVSLGVDANGTNWQTAGYWASLRAAAPLGIDDGMNFLRISRTAPFGFKYWEVGNECYGTWETDSNAVPNDSYTYATRAAIYIPLMRAVDPTIKIGMVATPGEDSSVNGNTTHPAYNTRTATTHYGWVPVVLTTLINLGVTPDFMVHHVYPEYGTDNDATLLQAASNWASDAANLRQMVNDYIGSNIGSNIELLATENNADSGNQGKQSTSVVNGLYLADSLAQLMKTEFNSFVWWDLRNGTDTSGDFSASLYGWRTNGDLGVVGNLNTRYPTFYTFKLMQKFVQPGDTVLTSASDYSLLSAYAVRRSDGSLTVLAINKDPLNTYTGQVAVAGFTPASSATIYSYGIPQDEATRTNGPAAAQDIAQTTYLGASTNFNYTFTPYTATVLTLGPAPAQLLALSAANSQFVFQLQGQANVPYVVQYSPDMINWTSASTNSFPGTVLNITNSISSGIPAQFWRAIWQP